MEFLCILAAGWALREAIRAWRRPCRHESCERCTGRRAPQSHQGRRLPYGVIPGVTNNPVVDHGPPPPPPPRRTRGR